MTIIVILSPPIPCVTLGSSLIISSSISAPISVGDFESIRSLTYWTAFSFVRQSQIPSQPRIINSSSGSNATLYFQSKILISQIPGQAKSTLALSTYCTMSGSDVIICSGGGIPGTCLYLRSPIERDRFRFPFTLPNWFTKPPAFAIRELSLSCIGL